MATGEFGEGGEEDGAVDAWYCERMSKTVGGRDVPMALATNMTKTSPMRRGMLYSRSTRSQDISLASPPTQCSTPAWKWQFRSDEPLDSAP